MGDWEDFESVLKVSLFMGFVGMPLLIFVVKDSNLELPIMILLWLIPAIVFAGSILSDAEANLVSVGSFIGWIVANAIIIKVTGNWMGVALTILVVIVIVYMKSRQE